MQTAALATVIALVALAVYAVSLFGAWCAGASMGYCAGMRDAEDLDAPARWTVPEANIAAAVRRCASPETPVGECDASEAGEMASPCPPGFCATAPEAAGVIQREALAPTLQQLRKS